MSSPFLLGTKHIISYMSCRAPLGNIATDADNFLYLHDKCGCKRGNSIYIM